MALLYTITIVYTQLQGFFVIPLISDSLKLIIFVLALHSAVYALYTVQCYYSPDEGNTNPINDKQNKIRKLQRTLKQIIQSILYYPRTSIIPGF